MPPEFFENPLPTPVNDSGFSTTVIPVLSFFTFDGGSASMTSNPPLDGGNASYVPVLEGA